MYMILMAMIVVSAYSVLAVCSAVMVFFALYGRLILGVCGVITVFVYIIGLLLVNAILKSLHPVGEPESTKEKMVKLLHVALRVLRVFCAFMVLVGAIMSLVAWLIL